MWQNLREPINTGKAADETFLTVVCPKDGVGETHPHVRCIIHTEAEEPHVFG